MTYEPTPQIVYLHYMYICIDGANTIAILGFAVIIYSFVVMSLKDWEMRH